MSDQCPNCKASETRIDGFCSIYCRDINEIGEEAKRYKQALERVAKNEYPDEPRPDCTEAENCHANIIEIAKEALKGE